ncbi:hypothetical protein GP982_21010 [Escherichia coli]|uniref:Uncharacterized protein n=1 Tax=Escherichia coli TaxID=562 RepID=A0A6D0I2I4_ECOLX|nr:hypothetical protein [Escherichia coli]KAE9862084.1 hypothetical protein GP667_23735 [Escherichia coli]MWR12646.1 hypothetical protein [Escherichia coli]MWS16029.1 hypothetical protein [Escherichia coli]
MLPGDVCIFNVLYQIDVFLGRDEGITTEAIHNAIKCTVAFRGGNTLTENSDDIAVIVCPDLLRLGGEYYCAEIMFLYALVYSPYLNIIWRTYWQNRRESGINSSGLMFWLL